MAGVTTLADLRTRARTLADMTGSAFVSDAELDVFINNGARRLHQLLANRHETYFESEQTINIVSGTSDYALASDFAKLLDVDILISGTDYYTIDPLSRADRNRVGAAARIWDVRDRDALRYQLRGDNLRFLPVPTTASTARVRYVPQMTALVNGTDTLANTLMDQWADYVDNFAARKMRVKEESDVGELDQELSRLARDIEKSTIGRDAGHPRQSSVIRGRYDYEDDFFG